MTEAPKHCRAVPVIQNISNYKKLAAVHQGPTLLKTEAVHAVSIYRIQQQTIATSEF